MERDTRDTGGFYVIYNGTPVTVTKRRDDTGYTAYVNNRVLGDASTFEVALDCAFDYVDRLGIERRN